MSGVPGPGRVLCPVCHHSVRVTEAGTIAIHAAQATMVMTPARCTGSGRLPPQGKP